MKMFLFVLLLGIGAPVFCFSLFSQGKPVLILNIIVILALIIFAFILKAREKKDE